MLQVSCQCRRIQFTTSRPEPYDLYFCHCTECRKQSASAFGCSAIFPTKEIWPLTPELRNELSVWTRPSKTGGTMQCYFCKTCGCRVLHLSILPNGDLGEYVSVKGGCIEGLDMSSAKHIYTGRAVIPVPEDGVPGSPSEEV